MVLQNLALGWEWLLIYGRSLRRSLSEFLNRSNEDSATADAVCRILREGRSLPGSARLVDVGAGPGRKIALMGRCLAEVGTTHVAFVEQDVSWQAELNQSTRMLQKLGISSSLVGASFSTTEAHRLVKNAQWVTVFHVAYDQRTTDALATLLSAALGPESVALLTCEASCSDLAMLKRSLHTKLGVGVAASCLDTLERSLKASRFNVESRTISGQSLAVSGGDQSAGWLQDLLLGQDGEYERLDAEARRATDKIITEHLHRKAFRLAIPDTCLIVTRHNRSSIHAS